MKSKTSLIVNVSLRACLTALTLLLATACAHQRGVEGEPLGTSIPTIASIGKIRIGYSTQEDLERCWGQGKTLTGSHPNSGRLWQVRGTLWVVYADGFEYSKRGLVVDTLSIAEDPKAGKDVPFAHLSASDLAWLGEVSVGMSEAKVTEVLRRKGMAVKQADWGCETQAKGFYALVSDGSLQTWTVRFGFKNELLNTLQLFASQ